MKFNNFSCLIFLSQNVSILPSPKILLGAKCVNTPKLYTTVNDQSNPNYSVRNEIIYSTEVLKSNFCDYLI